jgi:hypothetical protein
VQKRIFVQAAKVKNDTDFVIKEGKIVDWNDKIPQDEKSSLPLIPRP